ncbi:protein inscuteable-like [Tropilaelaps mercedesae]|uniref:Protein inscuteable-like n=1 Tax=Tropilaelaps mercedesae TaxID=418985 RepID=A0A1V9WYK4_9ACAR|nr:protein inscuteable-like [Tropilaelaps mercedesae]
MPRTGRVQTSTPAVDEPRMPSIRENREVSAPEYFALSSGFRGEVAALGFVSLKCECANSACSEASVDCANVPSGKNSVNSSFESDYQKPANGGGPTARLTRKSSTGSTTTSSTTSEPDDGRQSSFSCSSGEAEWLVQSIEQVCRKTLFKKVATNTVNEFVATPLTKTEKLPSPILKHKTPVVEPKKSSPVTSTPKRPGQAKSLIRRCSLRLRRSDDKKKMVRFASAEDVFSVSAREDFTETDLSATVASLPLRGKYGSSPQEPLPLGSSTGESHIYDPVTPVHMETPRVPVRHRRSLQQVTKRLNFDDTSDQSHIYATAFEQPQPSSAVQLEESHPLSHYLQWIVEQSDLNAAPSVQQWLKQTRTHVETECLSALQSKSLTKDPILAAILSVGDAQEAISRLQDRHESVQATVGHVTRRLEQGQWVKFCSSVPGLSTEVNDFLLEYRSTIENSSPYSRSVERHMYETLRRLRDVGSRPNSKPQTLAEFENVQSLMADVKNTLQTLANSLFLKEIAKTTATRTFDQCAGVLVIRDILHDKNSSEQEKMEAVGLLTQITAPWTETPVLRGMKESMDQLVKSLTEVMNKASNGEEFLLATAAIANLSFLDPIAVAFMHKYGTTRSLIMACRHKSIAQSVFVKDQIATVLANVCAEKACHRDVVECGGLTVLLSLLQMRPNALQKQVEIDICERIQQKSAIALARLCTSPSVTERVIQMQGVHRLVTLCKEPKERNNADSVLVACLATLRKIAAVCSPMDMQAIGAHDLVSKELWDTFQMYSNKTESYV